MQITVVQSDAIYNTVSLSQSKLAYVTINKYTQILRSRRKGVEMLLKKKSLKITFKTF